MKRDFALRIDSLLGGVRSSLDAMVEYDFGIMCRPAIYRTIEFKRHLNLIAKSMVGPIDFSNELYRLFPDITPDELKGEPPKSK